MTLDQELQTPPAPLTAHERIREKLQARKQAQIIEVDKLEAIDHESFGETFFAGAMSYDMHRKWMDLRRFEDISHTDQNKTDEDPKDRSRSDVILLSNAVYTEDGINLGEDMSKGLLSLLDGGPDNFRLLQAAEKHNPPREMLATEVAQMMNKSTIDVIMWRILMEAGLGKVLIDYMSTHSTPEEKAWAEGEMAKIAEVVYAFQPLFEAEDTARVLGVTFREGVNLIAMYNDSSSAVIAYNEAIEEKLE